MKLIDRRLLGALSLAMRWHCRRCAPLVIGAVAAGTAIVATDRRSTGTQLDDKTIQVRVANELKDALRGNDIHINVNSFERRVLLTGEVNSEAVKAQAGTVAAALERRSHGQQRTGHCERRQPSVSAPRTTHWVHVCAQRSSIRARLRLTRSTSSPSGARSI